MGSTAGHPAPVPLVTQHGGQAGQGRVRGASPGAVPFCFREGEMSFENGGRAVLFIGPDPRRLIAHAEAVRRCGSQVALADGVDEALGTMMSGFDADVIVVDVDAGTRMVWTLLARLYREPSWRLLPVLLAASQSAELRLFQIAPRHRQRRLPSTSSSAVLAALLEVIGSGDEDGAAALPAD